MQALQLSTSQVRPPSHFRHGRVERPTEAQRDEVLAYLNRRPIHTAYLAGIARDNGLSSELNRGTFYTYRNSNNEIDGVALIGHATMIETSNDEALRAFAITARNHDAPHLVMFQEDLLTRFWAHYASPASIRLTSRQLLLELRWPATASRKGHELRPATEDDIEILIPVHAAMACEESGIDPRHVDMNGFVERYARRVQQGRTWVLTKGNELIFKAEVVTQTPETSYVEGVWVHPELRGQHFGQECMDQLARMLMWRSRSICLFVNDENERAQQFYKHCGYNLRGVFGTIFLKQHTSNQ